MNRRELLLERLDGIGRSLSKSEEVRALLGLGSVGLELDRLDEYSDLDFFVIVREGSKSRFIQNLDWLDSVHPLAFYFRNTDDGYKALFEDGIFCEFAVFEEQELPKIPFAEGKIVWKREGFNDSLCIPKKYDAKKKNSTDWLVGEALTNLYVGLCRYRRGEKLSAARFIQSYAVDRILELSEIIENEIGVYKDPFSIERRYEVRFPHISKELGRFIQGYDRSIESARAIIEFLDGHFELNSAIKKEILLLCEER
jgi:lincosamide nucleotidyltransferase B/F